MWQDFPGACVFFYIGLAVSAWLVLPPLFALALRSLLGGKRQGRSVQVRGSVALCCGCSEGIGRGIARSLAAAGAHVIIVSRSQAKIDAVVSQLKAEGYKADGMAADLESDAAVAGLVAGVQRGHGTPDIIVCSSARGGLLSIDEAGVGDAMDAINSTYLAAFRVVKGFIASMLARADKPSHICIVGSPIRCLPRYFSETYVSSRLALFGFSESLREDLHGSNVSVSFCEPAFVPDSAYFTSNPGSLARLPFSKFISQYSIFHAPSTQIGNQVVAAIEQGQEIIGSWQMQVMNALQFFSPSLLAFLHRHSFVSEAQGGPPRRVSSSSK